MRQRRQRIARGKSAHDDGAPSGDDLAAALLNAVSTPPPRPAGALRPTLLGALVIGLAAWGAAELAIGQRRADLEDAARTQTETLAEANAALLSAQVAGASQLARRITRSELVQAYAGSAVNRDDVAPWLSDQAPFLVQMFEDFADQQGLLATSLLTADGRVLLKVGELGGEPVLPAEPGNGIDPEVTPIYRLPPAGAAGHMLAFDIVLPVPSGARVGEPVAPRAFLVATLDARTVLAGSVDAEGPAAPILAQEGTNELRVSVDGAESSPTATVVRTNVEGTPWLLEQPVVPLLTEGRMAEFRREALTVAAAIALLLTLGFGVFCGMLARRRRREHELAEQANLEQARGFSTLFENLAEQVSEGVALKGADGRYVYANRALGERIGRPSREIMGFTDEELASAGHDGSQASGSPRGGSLVKTDGPALVVVPHPVLQAGVAAEEAALPASPIGRFSADQAISLLVRAVELRDPFLRGHAERVAELSGAVAAKMQLSEAECISIELTARLSQIGKIFIPDAILTKPGRHNEEEARIMRSHVERALDLLGDIDLGLPVGFLLGQMHERLDGSGYPRGLSSDDITLPGRILGAVDVFCARTAPRAHREQVSAGQALFHLAGHPELFDARVVTALVAVFADMRRGAPALPAPAPAHADAA